MIFEEVFLQLELGSKCLGFGLKTSSNALDLHCNDLTHPLAIERTNLQTNGYFQQSKYLL